MITVRIPDPAEPLALAVGVLAVVGLTVRPDVVAVAVRLEGSEVMLRVALAIWEKLSE